MSFRNAWHGRSGGQEAFAGCQGVAMVVVRAASSPCCFLARYVLMGSCAAVAIE